LQRRGLNKAGAVRGEGRVEQEFKYQLIFNTFVASFHGIPIIKDYSYVPPVIPDVMFFPANQSGWLVHIEKLYIFLPGLQ